MSIDDRRARIDAMAGITDRAPVDGDRTGFNQRLEPRARQLADMSGKQTVEPSAGLIGRNAD